MGGWDKKGVDAGGRAIPKESLAMPVAISVILPTFNRERTLGQALQSALAQSHRDLEVIVVDDGSVDETRVLVEQAMAGDARVRYHHQSNHGVASARNAGIRLANGSYLAFLDSDDAWRPWHLTLMMAALARLPEAGLVWTDMDAVDAAGTVIASGHLASTLSAYRYFSKDQLFSDSIPLTDLAVEIPPRYRDRRLYIGDIYSPMVMGNLVLPSSVLMRRTLLDQLGGFDEALVTGEDYEFFLRACRVGPVAFADIEDVLYRVGTADRLSGPAMSLPIARAYLQVLERTLAQDADRITLPSAMVVEAQAYAHGWVGESELRQGTPRAARRHLARAYRLGGPRARTALAFALTFVPRQVMAGVLGWRRPRKVAVRPDTGAPRTTKD
jgi:GT2 family glycosyltransferase